MVKDNRLEFFLTDLALRRANHRRKYFKQSDVICPAEVDYLRDEDLSMIYSVCRRYKTDPQQYTDLYIKRLFLK